MVPRSLSSNDEVCGHTEVILNLVRKYSSKGDSAAEIKILAMIPDVALQNEDFDRVCKFDRQIINFTTGLKDGGVDVRSSTQATSEKTGSTGWAPGSMSRARKFRRRQAHKAEAAVLCAHPITLLRPVVRVPTDCNNRELGEVCRFALAELNEVGNLGEQGKTLDVEGLRAYKAKLIVFPCKAGKPKNAPPPSLNAVASHKITEEEGGFDAVEAIRDAKLCVTKREEEGINGK
ncbi:hypothetical protein BDM02DRAFT_3273221 [Thelephora ganbajun]|uniref:Uncharacterized protein n=1 Tax=Thelephora ganbajun TaxID=370292 RepID=A0ACB6Z0I8_THEGA|nr:hypothetical protein BDM02DRAFT_3273221 [Thelephora ganbajun]